MEEELLVIGKIVKAHGNQGKLRVYSYAESHATFSSQNFLYLKDRKGSIKRYKPTHVAPHKNVIILKLDGVSSIDEAERLVGGEILIEKSGLAALPENEYYWFEILGLKAFTDNGTFLGKVERILVTGSNDVYVIRNGEKEHMIPATDDVVTKIDLENKIIEVHPLEGLFEDGEI